jgi:hypothetical protein
MLERLRGPVQAPVVLRGLRSIEALEQMATAEARQFLRDVTKGGADTRLAREATAALERLAQSARVP